MAGDIEPDGTAWARAVSHRGAVAALLALLGSTTCEVRPDGDLPAAPPAAPHPSAWEGPPVRPGDTLSVAPPQVGPRSNLAMQDPDAFAWALFARVNAPAPSAPGGMVVWQTWADQGDLYPARPDPKAPPTWESARGFSHRSRLHRSVVRHVAERLQARHTPRATPPENGCDMGDLEEVRMNEDTFDYVVQNGLWYLDGQVDAFKKGLSINFPTSSIEVKANWIPIQASERTRYHSTVDDEGKLYGLVAMHIISKDVPAWTWATFEHRSNPCFAHYLPPVDDFGLTPSGTPSDALLTLFAAQGMDAEVWSNYRLQGAQVAPTTPDGRPVILGNSVTELGFQTTASCITCHARAVVGAETKGFSTGRLSVFDPDELFEDHPQGYRGPVDPRWFYDASFTERRFAQLDFVWSLACANAIGSLIQNCPQPEVDEGL